MMATASEALNAVLDWHGRPPVQDGEIESDCEQCGHTMTLASCRTEQTAKGRIYRCHSCPEVVLIVAPFIEGAKPRQGRGYRLDNWVLRNVTELRFRGVCLPASPDAAIDLPL